MVDLSNLYNCACVVFNEESAHRLKFSISPLRTRSRKVLRESSESELRTERDRQEVSAVTAARPADSILSLDVWNTCNETMRVNVSFRFCKT